MRTMFGTQQRTSAQSVGVSKRSLFNRLRKKIKHTSWLLQHTSNGGEPTLGFGQTSTPAGLEQSHVCPLMNSIQVSGLQPLRALASLDGEPASRVAVRAVGIFQDQCLVGGLWRQHLGFEDQRAIPISWVVAHRQELRQSMHGLCSASGGREAEAQHGNRQPPKNTACACSLRISSTFGPQQRSQLGLLPVEAILLVHEPGIYVVAARNSSSSTALESMGLRHLLPGQELLLWHVASCFLNQC